ncbi:MAG: preprotein translocase subunit SecG [Clostridia bacterium]|nr:preprotein translocase subunit SecG [Clostridia bacterium]
MSTMTYVFIALQIITTIAVIVLVMFQHLKEGDGLSGSSNEGGSGMGMSNEKRLSRLTIIFGIAFVIFTIVSSTLIYQDLK